MQITQIELFAKTIEELEQEEFISILHHDANMRGGMFTRFSIREDVNGNTEIHEVWSSKNAHSLMTLDATYNRYIALNSFHNIKESVVKKTKNGIEVKEERTLRRKETHLHTITTVYIDLDWHDGTRKEIEDRVNNTKVLLENIYQQNQLPRPTMITETGRGLGLFYVLDKSIANSGRCGKQIKFWEYICKEYAKKYQDILSGSEKDQLEVDFKVVGDKTRVVRLPGTKNLKTNSICRLISVQKQEDGTVAYFSLNDLVQYIETYNTYEKSYEEIRKQITQNKIVNFYAYSNPFLVARLDKLQRAQEVLHDKTEGYRELLCFLFYNTAKQLMTEKQAYEEMLNFNQKFKHPITDVKELQNIASSVAGATDMDNVERGFYKYKDSTLKELLDITDEQNEYVGFGAARKEIIRRQRKEENRKKKQERNETIISYVMEHPEVTYEEIAGLFEVSLRTLKNILKEADVHRYQKQEKETSICAAEKLEVDDTPVQEKAMNNILQFEKVNHAKRDSHTRNEAVQKVKVQKNASVSELCCLKPIRIIDENHLDLIGNDVISEKVYPQTEHFYVSGHFQEGYHDFYLLDQEELSKIPFQESALE